MKLQWNTILHIIVTSDACRGNDDKTLSIWEWIQYGPKKLIGRSALSIGVEIVNELVHPASAFPGEAIALLLISDAVCDEDYAFP